MISKKITELHTLQNDSNNDKVLSVKDKLTESIMYTTPDGNVKVEIFVHKETLWLNQEKIEVLFGVQRRIIDYDPKSDITKATMNGVDYEKIS